MHGPGTLDQLPDDQHTACSAEINQGLARDRPDALFQLFRLRGLGMAQQIFLAPQKHRKARQHADARRAESVFPAIGFAEERADQTGEQRADIDAGVENGEARVAPRIVVGIELADDGGDVGLQESHAHDDQRQRQVKHLQRAFVAHHHAIHQARGLAFKCHAEMAETQQHAAEHHRLAHAQKTVGQQAANHRHRVHQTAVGAEQVVARVVTKQVIFQDIQQQQRLHPVEGEALPHLGEKTDV